MAGNQAPQTGNSYSGLFAFQPPDFREYIETKLIDTLETGRQYCIQFFLSLGDGSKYATDRIQCLFSDTLITVNSGSVLNYAPQIENPSGNFLSDKTNWMHFESIYTSIGTENYILLGNFYADALTDTQNVSGGGINGAYYYIDDVSVVEIIPANAGIDTTVCVDDTLMIGDISTFGADYIWTKLSGAAIIDSPNVAQPRITSGAGGSSVFALQKTQCSSVTYDTVQVTFSCVGMSERNFDYLFSVFPNPANDEIIIRNKNKVPVNSIYMTDISGKETKGISPFDWDNITVNCSGIESGIYFLRFNFADGYYCTEKVVIQH